MKILGLTASNFAAAIIFGALIAGVFVFANAPHPVIVPTQVITPVPTPPPVVRTAQPTQAPQQIPLGSCDNSGATGMLGGEIPIVLIVIGISVIGVMALSSGSMGGTGMIGMIIALIGVIIALYIMSVVVGSISCAITMVQP